MRRFVFAPTRNFFATSKYPFRIWSLLESDKEDDTFWSIDKALITECTVYQAVANPAAMLETENRKLAELADVLNLTGMVGLTWLT